MHQSTIKLVFWSVLLTLLSLTNIINSSQVIQTSFINHKDNDDANPSTVKVEVKSQKNDSIDLLPNFALTNETPIDASTSQSRSNVRKIISPMQDSYLNALEYSHLSNNPHEGIVPSMDVKPKLRKVIRRTYDTPVYQPHTEYGPPQEPTSTYDTPNSLVEPLNIPRIVYGTADAILPTSETFQPTPSNSYSIPTQQIVKFNSQNSYGNGNKYITSPQLNYASPSPTYGPVPVPQRIYGPPHNNYLPAIKPQQGEARVYGSPQSSGFALPELPQLPSLPSIDFSFPFALKLNAYTIAKIILKLIIFKMIVKFIAVLCLLLFIPKLEMKKEEDDATEEDDDDASRKLLTPHFSYERLNNLTSIVLESIEMYNRTNGVKLNNGEKCTSVNCNIKRFLQSGNSWNNYLNSFYNYVDEEENIISSTDKKSSTKIL